MQNSLRSFYKKSVSKDIQNEQVFNLETKQILFNELNIKGNLAANKIIELLGHNAKDWEINYSSIEGNRTNEVSYNAYLKILELEGYDTKDLLKVKSNKDEVELEDIEISATEIQDMVKRIFQSLGINTGILEFDAELVGKAFEQQLSYQLWHLLLPYKVTTQPAVMKNYSNC